MIQTGISAAPCAVQWLEETPSPRLLHIFDQAVNLLNENGQVLSINTRHIGNGPFTLVVNYGGFEEILSLKLKVTVSPELISIGEFQIDCRHLRIWNPRPNWEKISRTQIQTLQEMIHKMLSAKPGKNNFPSVINPPTENNQNLSPFIRPMSKAVAIIEEGFQQGNTTRILEGATALAGLGGGLTPSGDDFLTGMMHGLWARRIDYAQSLCEQFVNSAARHTNTLSTAWLKAASQGEATESWHYLLSSLISRDSLELETALTKIIDTGHTSGADALAGFIFILSQEEIP